MEEENKERKPSHYRRSGKRLITVPCSQEEFDLITAAAAEDRRPKGEWLLLLGVSAAKTAKRRNAQKKNED